MPFDIPDYPPCTSYRKPARDFAGDPTDKGVEERGDIYVFQETPADKFDSKEEER